MKKVRNIFSSVCNKVAGKKYVALFSATVIVFTLMTFTLHYTAETTASAKSLDNVIGSQKILELSESFLSPNADNNISVLEVSDMLLLESESECESVVLIEELSTGSESDRDVEETQDVTTETTTEAPETTTKEVSTQGETAADSDFVSSDQVGYSFAELGIKQMSDIPVPDSIRFDENGIPLNYRYTLSGKSTTYNMGTTTATGTRVHPGVVAVNPKIIPYGTKMYIVANDGSGYVYGYSSAEDTGGFIHWKNGPLVDLYVYTMDDVYYWGNKPVTIYIF